MGKRVIILLTVLMFSLFGTAIVINTLLTESDVLALDAQTMSENIHRKESIVEAVFQDSVKLKTFENADRYPSQVLSITQPYATEELIFFFVFKDEEPIFWSGSVFVPSISTNNDLNTFLLRDESRYLLVKQHALAENKKLVGVIPIKKSFALTNQYLINGFYRDIISTDNVEIADYGDTSAIRNVYAKDGTYLLSVKFKPGKYHNIYVTLQLFCWVTGTLILLILINNWCVNFAQRGRAWLSVLLFAGVLIIVRLISLQTNWLTDYSSLIVFDPAYYAFSPFLPNLWGFIIMTISVAWLLVFVQIVQQQLIAQNKVSHGIRSIVFSILGLSSIYVFSHFLFSHLSSLITHTPNINIDFTNILEFDMYSWLCVVLFCINIIILLFYIDIVVTQVRRMANSMTTELNVHLVVLIISLIIGSFFIENRTYFNLILGSIIILRAYSSSQLSQYQFFSFIGTLLMISVLSSLVYMQSMREDKLNEMKLTLTHFKAEDDENATSLFADIESKIAKDERLTSLLSSNKGSEQQVSDLNEYLKVHYLEGYLSKYEASFFYYLDGVPLVPYEVDIVEEYREKVINQSIRVPQTAHFYRLRSDLGTHEYFLQMEIPLQDSSSKAQLFINLKNRSYSPVLPYPEILRDAQTDFIREYYYSDASFALYRNHFLVTQSGSYIYPVNDLQYPEDLNNFIPLPDAKGYFHMMLKPDIHTTLLVSKPLYGVWKTSAIVSFLFIALFAVFVITKALQNVIFFLFNREVSLRSFRMQLVLIRNKLRYSTRIQTMVIVTVIFAVLVSGAIAFFTLRWQLEDGAMTLQERQVTEIAKVLENMNEEEGWHAQSGDKLDYISEMGSIDVNLFDRSGQLIYTSQPRIYDLGLLSPYMNPAAYNELNVMKKVSMTHTERIGNFHFNSSYSTIRDDQYNLVAFINTPNYSSKREEIESSNLLLNSLLNIYTIIILVTGFIAVLVSRRVTHPLEMIGQKLSETNINDKVGEPIFWEKDDEIGALVKEYNLMLVKIEESTRQLMNAEREYAWREMARQVAHEIKNPLTPMKLGVQQLMRSFNENDPKFEQRFSKFSASFIEQIDNLSRIAVEFSNFAKMPQTEFVTVDIMEVIQRAVTLFGSSVNTVLTIHNATEHSQLFVLGDKDQLLSTFNNLLKNSVEAAFSRKKHLIKISLEIDPEGTLVIVVEDNGMGIPADVIPKIFQPNFTTKSSGTGLGLAFVKKTIESMNGTISFTTTENVGTAFTIVLPLVEDHSERITT